CPVRNHLTARGTASPFTFCVVTIGRGPPRLRMGGRRPTGPSDPGRQALRPATRQGHGGDIMASSAGIRRRRRQRAGLAALAAAVVLVGVVGIVAARDPVVDPATTGDGPVMQVFHLDTCPHCRAALAWLPTLEAAHPTLRVELHEVSNPA